MEVEFLIVGQGLAGTLLAFDLMSRGKKIMIISDPKQPCASRVAAGLYNPITGNKLVKTWKAEVLFSGLEAYYQQLEQLLLTKFLHTTGIYRPFTSLMEQNDWMAKSADPSFKDFVGQVASCSHESAMFNDPFGGVYLKNAGFLDTNVFLDSAKKYFHAKGCLAEELFLEEKVNLEAEGVVYGKINAYKLVLCNGLGAQKTSLFGWLPFHALKGEILEIKANLKAQMVFNRGCFMLPTTGGTWKVGSTYNWRQPDHIPSEEGKKELLQKLNQLYKGGVEIQNHLSGVRPSTADRRPLLGAHPEHPAVAIFNGLGTKGVSLGPHFAAEMARYLVSGEPLSKEVDIERYFSLYFERIAG